MSYTVFALKWRPQNLDEIVGQNHIVAILKNALAGKRLGHAYLFAGPRGVGKTSTARILAKALNCKDGPTAKPCQKCPSCLEITKGSSLDVIEIDGASNRGIDEIRALRENVKFAPVHGKYKIYIIDEVHQITTDGFNALLKTLEEPPEFVKFIFATTSPQKVIPTVLSRCQRLDFRRISVLEAVSQLEKISAKENISVDKEVLVAIAHASDGSLRDAESILDQVISFSKEKVSLKDVISMLGSVEENTLFEISEKIIQKDARGALDVFDMLVNQGKDPQVFLMGLIEHFRNLMVAKVAQADSRLIDLPRESCERLAEQSQKFSLEEIFHIFNVLVNTQEMAKRLDSMRIPLEISLVKLAYDKKGVQQSNSGFLQQKAVAPAPENKPAEVLPEDTKKPAPQENTSGGVSLDSLTGRWKDIIDNLSRVKISVATYLNEGQPVKLENNILTVSFALNHSLHKESLERKENKMLIEKFISEFLNTNLRVNFILSAQVPEKHKDEDETYLKSVLDAFDGRVIRDS
ncbi:MAG: DNA polymerase III subunit gamma/tau [Candidatus Omnitrophica bacterium]|nr:DNA polymerase III subunit gamma/tau [Candidatus Omnitrophota bacterium]